MSETLIKQCYDLLNWYREHQYLLGAQSARGKLFRRVDETFRVAFECLPEQHRYILMGFYVQRLHDYEIFSQLAVGKSQFYRHKKSAVKMLIEIIGASKIAEMTDDLNIREV